MLPPLVKRAHGAEDRSRRRAEAAVLHRARHPGIVRLTDFVDDGGVTTLTLAAVDGPTLAERPPADGAVALRLAAALATTVADLHELRIAHGALLPEHVLLPDDRRPILCGFGDATVSADDVALVADARALVDLLELLAVSTDARGDRASRRAVGALHDVVATARRPPTPTAAELARLLGRAAGRTPREQHRETPTARPGIPRAVVRGAAVGVVPAIVVLALAFHTGRAPAPGDPSAASTTSPAPSATAAPDRTAPVQVQAGGATYEVGRTGDRVVVADWTCTGEPAAMVLRPGTGEVWLVDPLPVAGEVAVATPVATVPGAVDLPTDAAEVACPPWSVIAADGTRRTLEDR